MVILRPNLTYLSWAAKEITRIVSDQEPLDELAPKRLLRAQEFFEKYPMLVGGISLRDQISIKKFGGIKISLFREFVIDRFPVQIGKPTITTKYFVLRFAREENPPQEILVMPLFDRVLEVRPAKRFQVQRLIQEGERVPKIVYNTGYGYLDFLTQMIVLLFQNEFIKKREAPVAQKIFQEYVKETFPGLHSKIDFDEDTDSILKNSFKSIVGTLGGYYNPRNPRSAFTFKGYTEKTIRGILKDTKTNFSSDIQSTYDPYSWIYPQGDVNPEEFYSRKEAAEKMIRRIPSNDPKRAEKIDAISEAFRKVVRGGQEAESNPNISGSQAIGLLDGMILIQSAANWLSVHKSKLYRLIKKRKICSSKGRHLMLPQDVVESLKSHLQKEKFRRDLINQTRRRRKISHEGARKYVYRKLKQGLSVEEILNIPD